MGIRFRKQIKLLPGVRLNISAKGIGLGVGVPGARVSMNSSGRLTQSVGIPGSGLYYVKTKTVKPVKETRDKLVGKAVDAVKGTTKETIEKVRAPRAAKSIAGATWQSELGGMLQGETSAAAIAAVADRNPDARYSASLVELLRIALPAHDDRRARELIESMQSSRYFPEIDPFVQTHLNDAMITVPIAQGVTADMPVTSETLVFVLVEIKQRAGQLDAAIVDLQNLPPSALARVSIAELYAEKANWHEVMEVTNNVTPIDEASAYLLIQRGIALREQNFFNAAEIVLTDALSAPVSRADLKRYALIERGQTFLKSADKARARKDFETVLAQDSTYPGLQDLLRSTK